MDREILRHHCLWQKSWTGPSPLTTSPWSLSPRSSTTSHAPGSYRLSKTPKQVNNNIKPAIRRWKSVPSEIGQSQTYESEVLTIAEILDNRRQQRRYRRKPWTEKVTIKHNTHKYNKEFYYGNFLPSDITDAKRRTRKFVTNSKYGDIYEVRYDVDKKTKKEPQPFSRWLWEKEYNVWLTDKDRIGNNPGHTSQLERTTPVRSKTPTTTSSTQSKSRTDSYSKSVTSSRNLRSSQKTAPNPDLYASYHSHRLQQRRRHDAACLIQAVYRGWFVRRFVQNLKRKIRLEHLSSWEKFVNEYKDLIKRVQERYGIRKPHCAVDLKEMQAFLDSKLRYEQTFRRLAFGDRLLKEELPQFFTECDLHPTEREIQQAFEKVFKGGNNTAEVMFLLDCSTSVTPMCFHHLTQFVKSVVESFTIGPDNVRVGVIPYSDDVYQTFGINRYNLTHQICAAIDNINHREGLTRTDLALKEMKKMFMCARPGVQKIGIVITDGKSSSPERTLQTARHVREDNVNILTIGVGSQVDLGELRHIASSESNVYSVYDYSCIHRLTDVIARRTCLAACVLCQTILPRIRDSGLFLREVLELVWTLYLPIGCEISWYTEIEYDEKVKKSTDINTCLRFVIQTKIEREGFITLPSNVREGVEQVSDPDIALDRVNKWIAQKQKEGETFKGLN
ncbi:uncharacterized protein LOC125679923 isoform X3 [Ostrea edulis]|uniref:uncharacterized protein LOC125679923 isoform X3 n=1 Tax=Ostrea edulis TaxID=37623 RepID=UPI0024AFDCF6|nr:uncharacterized protein LOC125679923 isoform X3 [Ostrea edulis]